MQSAHITRWGGVAAIAAGALWLWGFPGLNEEFPPYSHAGGHLLLAAAGLLSLVALLGLRAYDAGRSGRLGVAGSAVAMLGAGLVFVGNAVEGLVEWDFGWFLFMLGMLGLLVFSTVVGIAARRAGVLPAWSALPLAIVPVAFLALMLGGPAIVALFNLPAPSDNEPPLALLVALTVSYGATWIALGYALLKGQDDRRLRAASESARTQAQSA